MTGDGRTRLDIRDVEIVVYSADVPRAGSPAGLDSVDRRGYGQLRGRARATHPGSGQVS